MPTIYAKTHKEKSDIAETIMNFRGGVTVTIEKGRTKYKSHKQDKMENKWHVEAFEQLKDNEPEYKRGEAKLLLGVPILRNENEAFKKDYDLMIKPLPYEWKIKMMMEPIDFPVTRRMTMKQKARYLDAVKTRYEEQGVILTIPKDDDDDFQQWQKRNCW